MIPILWIALACAQAAPLELRDGDRIAFVGDGFFERDLESNEIELALTEAHPKLNLTFRNMGWIGDTVYGTARSYFGAPEDGFALLTKQVREFKPTVVFVCYGMNESFDGEAGLPKFREGLKRLLEMIQIDTKRIVLISPLPAENTNLVRGFSPMKRNEALRLYRDAVQAAAVERGMPFVDMFEGGWLHRERFPVPKTVDQIHLTASGYRFAANHLLGTLGINRFSSGRLPADRLELLRAAIREKNLLYFYRSRPQNITYIFGFRSHEQGHLEREFPEFDRQVAEREAEIARLRTGGAPRPSEPPARHEAVPLDPEIERRSFTIAEGFEIHLFAAEPMIGKPIEMCFDARGRLWVATSTVYPQIRPGQIADDKLYVLEDTDGDGRADRSIVFADGLEMPSGVAPGDGGAYVANNAELLHLADTNGDGKADVRRVVLSGFGVEDTHQTLHSVKWGPDGALYFNQSIYIHSHIETPLGPRRLGGAGIWRFRPDTYELEVFTRGLVNPRGQTWDAWGESFGTDGAGSGGITYLVPGATLEHYTESTDRFLPSLNSGHPKYCNHELLSGRHLPDDWQGNIVANDFRANRIARFALSDDGAGFAAQLRPDLLTSTDRAFRPVDVRLGPDGAIYVADWYNPIIQHGEVDFRDPRRDKVHGRIWRISAKGRPPAPRPKLADVTIAELLEHLKSPEGYTRQQARRALAERPRPEALQALRSLKFEDDRHRLEVLWCYETLDAPEPALLKTLLDSSEPRARAVAVRVLGHWAARIPDASALLEARVVDDHPRVRLEAVRALARIPSSRSVEIATRALDRPMDRFLDYALWLTCYELRSLWQPPFEAGRLTFDGNDAHRDFALQAVRSPVAIDALLGKLEGKGWISEEARDDALAKIAAAANPDELGRLFARRYEPAQQVRVLATLARAARERGARPSGDPARIRDLLVHADAAVRAGAAELVGLWKLDSMRDELTRAAEADDTPAPARSGATAALAALSCRDVLVRLSQDPRPPVRTAAILALASIDPQAAASRAGPIFGEDPAATVDAFLRRKGGAEALAAALDPAKIPADAARLGLRHMYAAGRQEPALVKVLNAALGLAARSEALTPEARRGWVEAAARTGDAARGEAIFRRKELSCLKCHAIGGAGGQVGPDLSSVGTSAPPDYLVESILRPSANQKEGFVSMRVTTRDEEVVTGILARKTDEELILRDALRDALVAIPVKNVEHAEVIASLMPEGLADLLTDAELADLIRFLSELGRPGPYAVGTARVARRWRLLDASEAEAASQARPRDLGRIDGEPIYARVSGAVPIDELPRPVAWLQFQIHVSAPGKFVLKLNSADAATVWVGERRVEARDEIPVDLARGVVPVTIRLETAKRAEVLRCELLDAPGSAPQHALIVTGK
jgi:putative heme-binding domain-containing protein